MLTKDKNVKRDINALAVLSYYYLYDKLNNALSDDNFILSENNLPVVWELKSLIEVNGWWESIFHDSMTCYQR